MTNNFIRTFLKHKKIFKKNCLSKILLDIAHYIFCELDEMIDRIKRIIIKINIQFNKKV